MLKDQDIREPLFDFFDEKFGKVRIIEEKQIAKSRADVMLVLEEKLIGVEIKSDADTYARLARQVKDYNKFFDYNYVVVGSSHSKHIEEHVPEYWGIIEAINGMPKYKQRSKDFVITKIMEKVQWDLLHRQISEELFQRDYNTISEAIKEWRSSNKH